MISGETRRPPTWQPHPTSPFIALSTTFPSPFSCPLDFPYLTDDHGHALLLGLITCAAETPLCCQCILLPWSSLGATQTLTSLPWLQDLGRLGEPSIMMHTSTYWTLAENGSSTIAPASSAPPCRYAVHETITKPSKELSQPMRNITRSPPVSVSSPSRLPLVSYDVYSMHTPTALIELLYRWPCPVFQWLRNKEGRIQVSEKRISACETDFSDNKLCKFIDNYSKN